MALTYNDFKNGTKIYRGKVADRFNFNGREVFKINNGEYFIRTDSHILQITGFFPDIEIYQIQGRPVLVFLTNNNYTFIEQVNIIESRTTQPFDGFEPNKRYELQNGQIWQQVDDTYAPNHHSAGNVKIINEEIIIVDNWNFFPKVKLISNENYF